MSSPPPETPQDTRNPWFGLWQRWFDASRRWVGRSPRTLLLVAIAFGVGLLLFLLLVTGQRGEEDGFFRAGETPAAPGSRDAQVFEPLPTPDAVGSGDTTRKERGDDRESAVSEDRQEDDDGFVTPYQEPEPILDAPPAAPPPPAPVASADASARPLHAPPPNYPAAAARRGDSGTVLVQVHVDAQGRPVQVDVVQSSHSRVLDREAERTVRQWTFSPAIRNGQPVPARVLVPIEFNRR